MPEPSPNASNSDFHTREPIDVAIADLACSFLPPDLKPHERQQLHNLFCLCHQRTREGHLLLDPGGADASGLQLDCMLLHAHLSESFHQNPANPIRWETPNCLYLRRHWAAEVATARAIRQLCQGPGGMPLTHSDAPDLPATLTAHQRSACEAIFKRPLLLLSGGPGTGKTFTILQIIRLVQHHHPNARIRLLAPTGKAVARIQESLRSSITQAAGEPDDPPQPVASTLHRFLKDMRPGMSGYQPFPRPDIPLDLVIVDEASMVDLQLLHRLLEQLHPQTRLILMGDVHQLASVQPGAVFASLFDALCDAPEQAATIHLNVGFRFRGNPALLELCESIRCGDANRCLQLLEPTSDVTSSIRFLELAESAKVDHLLRNWIQTHYLPVVEMQEAEAALSALSRCMILCTQNEGPLGVHALNHLILRASERRFLANTSACSWFWKPTMIRKNDPVSGLFNGDVGVVQHHPMAPHAQAIASFRGSEGTLHHHARHLLPDAVDSYACTIHKSQGSEADHVLIFLSNRIHPLLTRELLYTAVSRARHTVTVVATEAVLRHCITTPTRRESRLGERIRELMGK
jgi:exodeoxyribonuclease V alpha subunit